MKITDLLIIYFSAAAPFAVYFYFQNRARLDLKMLRLKTLLTLFFWLPFALQLLLKNNFFQKKFFSVERERKLYEIQKQFERLLREGNSPVSIYEFRETLNRYVGLTFAVQTENCSETGKEFFRAAENKNIKLAAKCFNRRNHRQLFFHQISARQDFLQIVKNLFINTSEKKKFIVLICEFVGILQDSEMQYSIEKIFTGKPQKSNKPVPVNDLEKDLWKRETRKPMPSSLNKPSILKILRVK